MKLSTKFPEDVVDPASVKNEVMKDIARGLGLKTPQGKVVTRLRREKLLKEKLGDGGYAAINVIVGSLVELSNRYADSIKAERKRARATKTIKIPKGSRITIVVEQE
jgi:hypothetical protein